VTLAPLMIRFYHRPLFVATCLTMLTATLKPYPSVADIGLYLSLLPMFSHQLVHVRGLNNTTTFCRL
jgi:phosphatidylinositol glycan class U